VSVWWGEFELPVGATWHWRVGPLGLWVTRLAHEWQLGHRWSSDPFDDTLTLAREAEFPLDVERRRYLFADSGPVLQLTPRVADRPVVTRPELPLIVPAGETARLFVSSAVWVELAVGQPARVLTEIPTWRMSSTWFGENPVEGTLCYATRSSAKLDPDPRSSRIITSVDIRNVRGAPLRVERLALPLMQMSVFADAQGQLWTEATRVNYDPEEQAPAELHNSPAKLVGATTLVSRSRADHQQNVLARALSAAIKGVWG
jgi:hypothetical protein